MTTDLSAGKQALLAKWLKGKEKGAGTIPRRPGPAPLSIMQQRLWFMEQLVPGTPAYNITQAIRLRGRLEVGVLEQVLTEIVARHEALRVRLVPGPGEEPVQSVSPPVEIRLRTEEAAAEELQALLDVEAAQPIDLTAGPLCRFRLFQLAPAEHAVVVTLHHIISDGWSMSVFVQELLTLYEAFADGLPSPLPALPVQHGDFAAWQRERADHGADQAWWKEQLKGPLPVLELPTDFPRPPVQSYRGRQHHFAISRELAGGVLRLCQQEGLTPFMVLYSAFVALLHRYSGQAEILCGTPVANRNRPEVEGLIGFFVNTLVLRTDLSGEPGFIDLARRVREFALGAFSHQELPFEKLVEELAPQRSLSHQPLFQVVFNLVMGRRDEVKSRFETEVEIGSTGTAQFDLMLALFQNDRGFHAYFEYATDLFRPATVERMASHYLTLLAGAVADPSARLGDLPLLTPAEETELEAWGTAPADYPRDETVHRLFAAEAARHPEAEALVWDGGRMTYGELDRRSNQLARRLAGLDVGPGALVGIAAERSPELIIGLLAILKAGGAYVPLDLSYPAERLAFMVADTGVRVLVAPRALAAKLPPHEAVVVEPDAADDSAEPLEMGDALSPAYVIYTSGSTGRPKGSLVPHRAIVRLVRGANFADLGPEQFFLQLAPVSFDASTLEI
ncbi:MAG TPA: condensation domain-containing protein, partial [Symbiobacteriaceae bacterium]|nr:condensation domain-containing protein [Symbiobacteriaceae bacterium]